MSTRNVLQGTVVGPNLFIIYLKDISSAIVLSNDKVFVDDSEIQKIFQLRKSPNSTDMQGVTQWAYKRKCF